jgi:hypothetical protein
MYGVAGSQSGFLGRFTRNLFGRFAAGFSGTGKGALELTFDRAFAAGAPAGCRFRRFGAASAPAGDEQERGRGHREDCGGLCNWSSWARSRHGINLTATNI